MTYLISACSGKRFDLKAGQTITVIDTEGGQVADFFAVCAENPDEFLSSAVTIDCNESLRIGTGSIIYTNLYRPMFEVVLDDVGRHDLLFPSCRPEMYDFFYGNGKGHPNCFDNINRVLTEKRLIINLDGLETTLRTEDLPETFHVGLTGCEGIVHFYDLKIEP